MKNTLLLAMAVVLAASFSSCRKILNDSGDYVIEVRDISDDFTEIEVSGDLDVYINQNGDELLQVEGGKNVLSHIKTTVEDGVLTIKEENNNYFRDKPVRVYVNKEMLDKIEKNGSGDLEAEDLISTNFTLDCSGSGDSEISFAEVLNVSSFIDGSGEVKLEGEGQSLYVAVNGSGDCRARYFEAEEANVNLNGSGDVEVFASESLIVNVNGSGDVRYWGNPAETNINVNGSGDVQNMDD